MRRRRFRRGAAIFLVLILLGAFLFFSAMAMNVAYMQQVRSELRAATDAAARAGAEALARQDSPEAAIDAAIEIPAANTVGGEPLILKPGDIGIGRSRQRGKSGKWDFTEGDKPFSSVRVNAAMPVPLLMFGVTGRKQFQPERSATAAFSENEICLVIDRSHSMCFDHTGVAWSYPPSTPPAPPHQIIHPPQANGSRWASLVHGVNTFLDAVTTSNATQRVALVTWGSEITLSSFEGSLTGQTFEASELDVPLAIEFSEIRSKLVSRGNDAMLGGTHMSAGIDMGVDILTGPDTHEYASKIIILMTDGKWNIGRNPVGAARAAKKKGITIHTVTFLDTADQTDMKKVAKTTGGNHYHATNTLELEEAFREMARNLPVVLVD